LTNTHQTSNSSPITYDAEAQTSGELATPSIPVPDINTQKHDALPLPDIDTQKNGPIPLSRWWEQQITKPVSIANAARQQIVSMLGSNKGSMRGGGALMESTK
jgi:hypothetical protein